MEEPRYCEKCGAYIPQGEEKCIACGAEGSSLPTATDKESALDLDALKGAPIKAKLYGEVGEAYITETTLEPVITCGRDVDGLMRRSVFTMARLTVIWRGAK